MRFRLVSSFNRAFWSAFGMSPYTARVFRLAAVRQVRADASKCSRDDERDPREQRALDSPDADGALDWRGEYRRHASRYTAAVAAMLSAVLLVLPARTLADQLGFQFAGGAADHGVKKADVGLVWNSGLKWWEIAGYHFELLGEAHAAYWDIRENGAINSNIWEFGVTPLFRFLRSTGRFRPYIEAGVGVRMLSHTGETADRTFSSSFQFADMVGVGLLFGSHQNYQAGYRFQHLSNAGIKHPNPGINFSEVYIQYNF